MRRATAPATCRASISVPSGVSMTTRLCSFSSLAFGSQARWKLPSKWLTRFIVPSAGTQLACTLKRLMKMLTIMRRSWKYSFSSVSSTTTTFPSHGATMSPSVSPSKVRTGHWKKFSRMP